ncbi:hypothetical protein EJN90_00005 [Jeotgalibaca ciconiae]|uniref:Phosphotransferase system EIIB component type 2/3 domain-containing protein n=1 Tax=Jeotgalibaca ciconiae TaxID=2496265 RepID=A0A3S9HE08_9LACT|nr:hypothetical protein EJN90_00005 [Jeotgalibaca ciconiae]
MKKGLIICAGGMSSSLLAKKVSEYFASKGEEIIVEATGIGEGAQALLTLAGRLVACQVVNPNVTCEWNFRNQF